MKSFHSNWPKAQKFSLFFEKFSLLQPNIFKGFYKFSLAFHSAQSLVPQGFEACFHQNHIKEWVPIFFYGVFYGNR